MYVQCEYSVGMVFLSYYICERTALRRSKAELVWTASTVNSASADLSNVKDFTVSRLFQEKLLNYCIGFVDRAGSRRRLVLNNLRAPRETIGTEKW